MAQQPQDLSAILQALAQQRQSITPAQGNPPPPQSAYPQPYPGAPSATGAPPGMSNFSLPQPTSSGSVDLNAIRPVATGNVNFQDSLAKARALAAQKGISSFDGGRSSAPPAREDPRLAGRNSYRPRSRSRSRSPAGRAGFRDGYNPYRDERRDDRRGGGGYGRERSNSPRRSTFSPPRNQNNRDRSPSRNNDEDVMMMDSQYVGLIIGRQGENLRRIEASTGARIQFVPGENTPRRRCRIRGTAHQKSDARKEIFRIMDDNAAQKGLPRPSQGDDDRNSQQSGRNSNQPALRDGEESIQIMVPDRTVGLVIGRGGETIRDLQDRSKCHVNIVGENKSINGFRPVNLLGTREAAAKAKELIMEIVESDTRNQQQSSNPRDQRSHDPYTGGSGSGGGGGDGKINETIRVPSDAVGMIIGKGGETIKEMQNQTGCKINVTQPAGADVDREVGLIGSRAAINDAKRVIWDKVDQVREKSGARRGNRDQDNNYNNERSGGYTQSLPSQQPQQNQGFGFPYGQMANMQTPQQPQSDAQQGDPASDPYAPYGGYANYVAMWYASQMAQQGQNQTQAPPGT